MVLSPTTQPHGFLHDFLVEFGIIVGINVLVNFLIPFPYSIPILVVSLALVALYRRKRTMRGVGLSVTTNDGCFVLNMIVHYSLLVIALVGVDFFLPIPFNIPANIVILALFVLDSERNSQ